MGIEVEGHNNRVAGRDYNEWHVSCDHCRQLRAERQRERLGKQQRNKWTGFTLLVLLMWGILLELEGSTADIAPSRFFEQGFTAAALVFLGIVVFVALREWWLFNGHDMKAALWQSLVQVVKGIWK